MWQRIGAATLLLALIGCGTDGPTDPSNTDPKAGRYSYSDGVYSGTVVIANVRGDLHEEGTDPLWDMTFAVSGWLPDASFGPYWNVDAYILWARIAGGTNIAIRLTWSGQSVTCKRKPVPSSIDFRACTMTYIGP